MKKNMGNTDRMLRLLVAAVFILLYLNGTVVGILGAILLVFAAVFVLTSFFGVCPLYTLVGIDTCRKK